MQYAFYTTSEEAWDAMLEAISAARKFIYLEMYILADNTPDHGFFEILKRKAQEGVKVKIIIDSVGSKSLKSHTIKDVRATGAELLFFSYWLQRTHKKILIVDEKIAFVGGVNIHKTFRKWNDLQMRVSGRIVKSIIRSFARTYAMCRGTDAHVLAWDKKKTVFGKTKLWIFEHWQGDERREIKNQYQESIASALKNITIVTPYLVPYRWLSGSLHQAILRGVTVEILLPEYTDHWAMDRMNYFYMYHLRKLGVQFYLSKGMNHAKAMLIDDTEGLVGSHNIDPLSFRYNMEVGVFFKKGKMVKELREIIEEWKSKSVVFDPSTKKPRWIDYVVSPLFRLFRTIF